MALPSRPSHASLLDFRTEPLPAFFRFQHVVGRLAEKRNRFDTERFQPRNGLGHIDQNDPVLRARVKLGRIAELRRGVATEQLARQRRGAFGLLHPPGAIFELQARG